MLGLFSLNSSFDQTALFAAWEQLSVGARGSDHTNYTNSTHGLSWLHCLMKTDLVSFVSPNNYKQWKQREALSFHIISQTNYEEKCHNMCSFSCLFLCSCVIDTAANKAHITLQLQSSYRKMTLSTAHLVWRCCCDCFLSAEWLPDKHSCMLMTRWLQRVPFICFSGKPQTFSWKLHVWLQKQLLHIQRYRFTMFSVFFCALMLFIMTMGLFRTGVKMQDHAGLQ